MRPDSRSHPCPWKGAHDVTTITRREHIDQTSPVRHGRWNWRVVDIVVAAVLGVATGVIFFAWNTPGYAWYEAANALTPGLGGLANGLWLLGGPLGGLIIRKPGAAIFVETIGAVVSTGLGNQWGMSTLWIGLLQGLGAELILLLVLYRRFNVAVALLAGAGAGIGSWLYTFLTGDIAKGFTYNAVYLTSTMISGALLAGLVAWLLTRALARTGVLSRFAAGRESTVH